MFWEGFTLGVALGVVVTVIVIVVGVIVVDWLFGAELELRT